MRTSADPQGVTVLGTLNNCASSKTPWGTYLSGEENFAFYFGAGDKPTKDQQRWGAPKSGFYAWDKHDPRFDLQKNPNELHRFGWVLQRMAEPLFIQAKMRALSTFINLSAATKLNRLAMA
jgi:secreted PhoX family phosphatase